MQYEIHGNYTGAFHLGFPFDFVDLKEAKKVTEVLNSLRPQLERWSALQPFQIWDKYTERWVG